MTWPLAQASVGIETLLSVASLGITVYFWFVKANRERPRLRFFQLGDFRASLRRVQGQDGMRRLCVQQADSCGILIANDSTRQNAIINYECAFRHDGRWIKGDWGYVDENKPPWNISPESSIGVGLAFFFDVEEGFEVPTQIEFRVIFNVVSGNQFVSSFWLKAPNLNLQQELVGQLRAA